MDKTEKETSLSTEPLPFKRHVKTDDIGDGEKSLIEADAAERQAIAAMLDLVALDRLGFACRLRRHGGGRIGLKGTLQATAIQACVLSLEPVECRLEVPVEAEFWPLAMIEQLEARAEDPNAHPLRDWPEPIVDGKIDLGSLIYETFATALDPYPKREGASLAWQESETSDAGRDAAKGPFAKLALLKRD